MTNTAHRQNIPLKCSERINTMQGFVKSDPPPVVWRCLIWREFTLVIGMFSCKNVVFSRKFLQIILNQENLQTSICTRSMCLAQKASLVRISVTNPANSFPFNSAHPGLQRTLNEQTSSSFVHTSAVANRLPAVAREFIASVHTKSIQGAQNLSLQRWL